MAELVDVRAKVTRRANAALEAEHLATGVDKSEIVRNIVESWASGKLHACNLMIECLRSEGLDALANGKSGKGRA